MNKFLTLQLKNKLFIMRIFKYLFLLFLLSLVALSIFVATQKGSFTIERSKIINSPKSSIYIYVNDLQNWKEWNSLAIGDSLININYSENTVGENSSFTWNGELGEGDLQTIKSIASDSIIQTINFNGNNANISMSFKDTLGKTKVTWKAKGSMGFYNKAISTLNGGANKFFGIMLENSLDNLNRILDYEINTFAVNVEGVINFPETHYLAQTFTSKFSKVAKNSEIVFSKIKRFCSSNNIATNGKPFVIYHTYDSKKEITKISICIPIKTSIFLMEGSDISSNTLPAMTVLSTTMTGDYSHSAKALRKSQEYVLEKSLSLDPVFSHIESYSVGKKDFPNPSKWSTKIYFPIKQKATPKPIVIKPKTSPEATPTPVVKKETPSEL